MGMGMSGASPVIRELPQIARGHLHLVVQSERRGHFGLGRLLLYCTLVVFYSFPSMMMRLWVSSVCFASSLSEWHPIERYRFLHRIHTATYLPLIVPSLLRFPVLDTGQVAHWAAKALYVTYYPAFFYHLRGSFTVLLSYIM
ncbi:hypothetical protein EDB82DRAFT_235370 [Fusarium venenatum]|uniref:uncharacterized protein n=1 Tax=Fusarium venenatum TaxID=56646 RepID=UPI001DF17F7C|nr:hypothetical protein EDB82DRAFT_235370 [Fusarium venenatum]